MNRCFLLACVLGLFVTAVGCEEKASAPTNANSATQNKDGGINIQWPGGSVQVDPKTGNTRVSTKGVNVDAGLKNGARVRTPKVDVDASGQGVDVKASGTHVDVNR